MREHKNLVTGIDDVKLAHLASVRGVLYIEEGLSNKDGHPWVRWEDAKNGLKYAMDLTHYSLGEIDSNLDNVKLRAMATASSNQKIGWRHVMDMCEWDTWSNEPEYWLNESFAGRSGHRMSSRDRRCRINESRSDFRLVRDFPEWAVVYMAYGDVGDLTDEEIETVDRWAKRNKVAELVDVIEGSENDFVAHPEFGLGSRTVDVIVSVYGPSDVGEELED